MLNAGCVVFVRYEHPMLPRAYTGISGHVPVWAGSSCRPSGDSGDAGLICKLVNARCIAAYSPGGLACGVTSNKHKNLEVVSQHAQNSVQRIFELL